MKQIGKIIKQDLLNVKRVPLVALLLLGLAFLPSLYAWFNIAATWDPYSNTGQIKVAVVNEDQGAEVDGEQIHIGDELVTNLRDNDEMGWHFVEREEAEEGVKKGDYYASVYIGSDFSEQLTSVLDGSPTAPVVHYEVNEKMNAIAPKMTSAGASAVVSQISEQFLAEASGALFTQFNEIGIELENELPTIRRLEQQIFNLEERFPEINELGSKVTELDAEWPDIKEKLEQVMELEQRFPEINQGAGYVLELEERLPEIHNLASQIKELEGMIPEIEEAADQIVTIGNRFGEIETELNEALEMVQTAEEGIARAQSALPKAGSIVENTEGYIDSIQDVLSEVEGSVDPIVDVIEQQARFVEQASAAVLTAIDQVESGESADVMLEQLNAINETLMANEEALTNAIDFLTELNEPLPSNDLLPLIESLTSTRDQVNQLQDSVQSAISTLESGGELDSATLDEIRERAETTESSALTVQDYFTNGGSETIKSAIREVQSEAASAGQDLEEVKDRLPDLEELLEQAAAISLTGEEQLQQLLDDFPAIEERINEGIAFIETELPKAVAAIERVNSFMEEDFPAIEERIHQAAAFIRDDLPVLEEEFSSMVDKLEENLPGFEEALEEVSSFVATQLPDLEESVGDAADRIRDFEENNNLEEIIELLKNDIEEESAFFREPVELEEQQLYPVPNYGSANAPFYTALSLWVGSLLLTNLLKTDVHRLDMREEYKIHHIYFGRLALFLLVSLFQALIVSIGNLFILGTYAAHPVWFVVFTVLVGFVFMTIVYTLASVFGNIGKAMAIIFMVLQLSGLVGRSQSKSHHRFSKQLIHFCRLRTRLTCFEKRLVVSYRRLYG
ncbi:YhgE/Pip domain-containing protein [Bacillus sp. JCM 19041]|uniref:YhgE/Pip family protein n=1 Tax=Bacillus sp. JCM 19041 TaxID=1460637 RepID=UPI0006D2C8EC